MSRKVSPVRDRTLAIKRTLFSGSYRAAGVPVIEGLMARYMAPHNLGLALAQGESLVLTPRRVLALTAHPDDLEFFAGGTLRRMTEGGSQVTAVVLSDGEKRGNWIGLGNQRRSEQALAAQLQGYKSVTFMGLPDFGLPEEPRLEHVVAQAWDEVAPEVVLAFDPKELIPQLANRDHKALGRTVMDLARARFHTGVQVYFYGSHHPDVLVDIDPVIDAKVWAVKAHISQMVYLDDEETTGAIRLLGRIMAGQAACTHAEALYRLM